MLLMKIQVHLVYIRLIGNGLTDGMNGLKRNIQEQHHFLKRLKEMDEQEHF